MALLGLIAGAVAAVAGYFWLTSGDTPTRYNTSSYNNYYDYDHYDYHDHYDNYTRPITTLAACSQPLILTKTKEKKRKLRLIEKLYVYRPDDLLLDLDDAHKVDAFVRVNLLDFKLSALNSHRIFGCLLQLEDVEELRTYLPLIQRNVFLKKINDKNYEVQISKELNVNIEDIVTPYCDEVVVIPYTLNSLENIKKYLVPGNDGKYANSVAIISDVSKTKLTFSFNELVPHLKNITRVNLIIRPRRHPLRYQRRALELFHDNVQMQQYLFPDYVPEIQRNHVQRSLYNIRIRSNPEQYRAVQNIVEGVGQYAPYIVFGPPGTGKTTTIVEAILQLRLHYPNYRILITAASNSACDTIAIKLCEHFAKSSSNKQLIRIYSKSILQHPSYEHIPQCLRKRSNLNWDEDGQAYPAVEDLNEYKIVISTLSTIGKYELAHFAWSKPFDYLFIDEAGATSEPEALIGIMAVNSMFSKRTRVILSGDHKQLGPVIKSKRADKLGLRKSLMERLLERKCYAVGSYGQYNTDLQIRLRRNYRSDPEIVKLYNHLYYENYLIAMCLKKANSKWSFLPNSSSPIGFQAVYGETVKGPSKSCFNLLEIKVLIAYIRLCLRVDGVRTTDVGVVTPYKLQSEHIRYELKSRNWCDIEVGSVENFQGREKSIIIASMVRSKSPLGFVRNEQRWNVLLSRPKSLLLILGNPATLNQFDDIKYVIDECERVGNYLGKRNYRNDESSEVEILNNWNKRILKGILKN